MSPPTFEHDNPDEVVAATHLETQFSRLAAADTRSRAFEVRVGGPLDLDESRSQYWATRYLTRSVVVTIPTNLPSSATTGTEW